MTNEEHAWIKTNNLICAVLRQAHDALALTSFPPRRKGNPLTEEMLNKLWGGFTDDMNRQQAMSFARAIERAHGIGEKE